MPPLVPGFILTAEMSSSATGSRWAAVRSVDGRRFVLSIVPVEDVAAAQAIAAQQVAVNEQVDSAHLIGQHGAIALADSTVALVLDEVNGGSLAQLVGARGQLSAGETVTTVAPLLRALADLHAAGVVHGHLAPGSVLFTGDGRPLIGDLGFARLMGSRTSPADGAGSAFVAPELMGGAAPSSASDVYAMAALGWFCLTGCSPSPVARRQSLTRLRSEVPPRLVEVLTDCLAPDPGARPSAGAAAVDLFDATPAETVAMVALADPAAEITRRIRAAAVSPAPLTNPGRRQRSLLTIGVVMALVAAVALGVGATWFMRRAPVPVPPAARPAATPAQRPATGTTTLPANRPHPRLAMAGTPTTRPRTMVRASPGSSKLAMASSSPRMASAGLLQELVDVRALAFATRDLGLLDLVYAPGATSSGVDKGNIATALKNGGTYLGLSFVVKDVAFLEARPNAARLRATVVTPAYQTGQPNGRTIRHAAETFGPCIFSLRLTPDGWRILDLTTS